MSLQARITKLESHRFMTAEQQLRAMSDEELEALWMSTRARLSDEDFEQTCQTYPERLSNPMDTAFCVDVSAESLEGYGRPEIFNTDSGSQFTSQAFTSVL
jgi:hypothetical protein